MAFTASYRSICDKCEGVITPGEQIQTSTEAQRGGQSYEHVVCPDERELATSQVCPSCHLFHKGECF